MHLCKNFTLSFLSVFLLPVFIIATPALSAQTQDYHGLQKEIIELNKKLKDQQKEIDTLHRHLTRVYKQTLDETSMAAPLKLALHADLKSEYDQLDTKHAAEPPGGYHVTFRNELNLKFSARPTDELQFHTTLTMYKLWGTWNSPQDVMNADFNYSSRPSDTGIRVKRAYVDYRPQWLGRHANLTFGRLPTSGGYLTQYTYNRPQQTSYPDLAFNAESDGAALSFYADDFPIQSLNIIYARSQDETDQHPFKKDINGLDDIDFYTVQINSRPSFIKDSLFVAQWFRIDNIRATGDDILRQVYAAIDDKDSTTTTLNFPDEFGYVDKYVLQFDAKHLFDLPIDFFVSGGWSRSRPNKKQILVNGSPIDPSTLPDKYKAAAKYLYPVSEDNQKAHKGAALYAGLRYTLDLGSDFSPKFGLEYFKGTKYWIGLNIAATDPYQKLNTRGTVWEAYYIQPLVKNMLQMRAGYQHIDRDYTESIMAGLYGAPEKTDEKNSLFYAGFDFRF